MGSTAQLLKNCHSLLKKADRIHFKVPWGYVRGIQVGPTDAPPVLMCHGWLDNCYSFVPLLTKLPQNRRYIALDLPGHGHSCHKPKDCYNFILNAVADMEHIRQSLELENLTLIGHSMSGILSIIYSSTFAEYIGKTVVLDSIFAFNKEPFEVVKNLRKSCDDHVNDPYRFKVYEDVDTLAKTMSDSTTTWYGGLNVELCKLIVERNTVPCEVGVKHSYDPKLRYGSLLYLTKEHYLEFIKAMEKPVLYLEGGQGVTSMFPHLKGIIEELKSMNGFITHGKVEGPHHFHMANPDSTAQYIEHFMNKNDFKV